MLFIIVAIINANNLLKGENYKLEKAIYKLKEERLELYTKLRDSVKYTVDIKESEQSTFFNENELKVLLKKCHPDKNSGENIYNDITVKLLKMYNK